MTDLLIKNITRDRFDVLAEYLCEKYRDDNFDLPEKVLSAVNEISKNLPEGKCDYFDLKKGGLNGDYLDWLLTEYTRVNDCLVLCVWSRAAGDKPRVAEVERLIDADSSFIVAQKDMSLNYNGLKHFMAHCYEQMAWCGSYAKHFKGLDNKVNHCYGLSNTVKVYVLENSDFEKITALKERTRSVYPYDIHSLHSSDNNAETEMMMQLLFNSNSRQLMNYGIIDTDIKYVDKLKAFAENVKSSGKKLADYIVVKDGVLALYGAKTVKDFVALSIDGALCDENLQPVEAACFMREAADRLILDPANHLYLYGVKALSPTVIAECENADKADRDLAAKLAKSAFSKKAAVTAVILYLKRFRLLLLKLIGKEVKYDTKYNKK